MDLSNYNSTVIDLSSVLYETIKKSLIAGRGYKLDHNPLKTQGKIAIVRALVLEDEQPDNGLVRTMVYFDEVEDYDGSVADEG